MSLPPDYVPNPDLHPLARALLQVPPAPEPESELARAIRERTEPDRLRLMETLGAPNDEPDIATEWRDRCRMLGLDASTWSGEERGR